MAEDEMFVSAIRSIDDQAGIFEHDGDTGYFYLCETKVGKQLKVVAAIRVVIGESDFRERDITVQWDAKENKVGLFIRGQLWAAFDTTTGCSIHMMQFHWLSVWTQRCSPLLHPR